MTATPKRAQILIAPRNEENPYLPLLRSALADIGVPTDWFAMDATANQTLNSLLAPLDLVRHRLRGARILHLQWVYPFGWPWTRGRPVVEALPRIWFGFVLWFAKALRYKVVFTWHDDTPLVQVFDDEVRARSMMIHRMDAVITITEAARDLLVEKWGVARGAITVIPEGAPTIRAVGGRDEAKSRLRVPNIPLIVTYGHIDPYRGVDDLLAASLAVSKETPFVIRILGRGRHPDHTERITTYIAELRDQGRDVSWTDRRFEDHELETLLAAADIVALPFRKITNSTTLRVAMASRRAVIIPNSLSLSDVPRDAAYRFEPDDPSSLCAVLEGLLKDLPADDDPRIESAYRWATAWTWNNVATATSQVYERVLRG